MNDKTNAMIDLFDNNINRLDNLFKRETLLNAFNNYANFDIKDRNERNEFKSCIDRWMSMIKFDSYRFPYCVLSVGQFINLCHNIGLPFPLSVYTNYDNIRIISNTTDEAGVVKAHDCYLVLVGFMLPVKLKMRLLYIPQVNKTLKITFAGIMNKYVMNTLDKMPTCGITKTTASDIIRYIPFELIRLIVSGCKANDDNYIEVWTQTVINNYL